MSKAWAGGSTRAWRRIRARRLAMDGRRCQLRIPGCTTIATEVHHTLGKSNSDDITHLVSACHNCNVKVGDPRAVTLRPDDEHSGDVRFFPFD